jgi:hypothetical protein
MAAHRYPLPPYPKALLERTRSGRNLQVVVLSLGLRSY